MSTSNKHNRLLVACLAAVTLCALSLLSIVWLQSNEPVGVPGKASVDFGSVHLSQRLTHVFTLTNPLKKPLRVEKVLNSCGCTSTKVGAQTIAPGASTTVEMTVQTNDVPGPMHVTTTVLATADGDPAPRPFKFLLNANPTNVIDIEAGARSIHLGSYQLADLPVRKNLKIARAAHPMDWDELICRSDDPSLEPTLLQNRPGEWTLDLHLKKGTTSGNCRSHLQFAFLKNGKELDHKLRKGVDYEVAGPIVAVPPSILIGVIESGKQVSSVVNIRPASPDFKDLTVVSASASDPKWVRADPLLDAGKPAVTVRLTGKDSEGPQDGQVTIVATVNGQPHTLRIPYYARAIPPNAPPLAQAAPTQGLLDRAMAVWNDGNKDEAAARFLTIKFEQDALFGKASVLARPEAIFVQQPVAQQTADKQDMLKQLASLNALCKHVIAMGKSAESAKQYPLAEQHYYAVLRCGRSLYANPGALLLVQGNGKARSRQALKELARMYAETARPDEQKAAEAEFARLASD